MYFENYEAKLEMNYFREFINSNSKWEKCEKKQGNIVLRIRSITQNIKMMKI